jgi:hypothetical protein
MGNFSGYITIIREYSRGIQRVFNKKPLTFTIKLSVNISGFYQCKSVERCYFVNGISFTGPINPEGIIFHFEASKGA